MTFLALLTKELRLRMRRERTIWVIIVYVLLMGLLGWFFINSSNSNASINGNGSDVIQSVGIQLYNLLSLVQLSLILFITPAFTSTTVNGEKERQTFDLLLCSKLSAFSLVSGKLVAGLVNAFLLIAASLPLFSLVFFFGGISPAQFLSAQLVFITTAILVGTFGLLCSTLFRRPAVSTAITYMVGLLWMVAPLIIFYIISISGTQAYSSLSVSVAPSGKVFTPLPPPAFTLTDIFIWNPVAALISTYPSTGGGIPRYMFSNPAIQPWLVYTILNIIVAIVFFLFSMRIARPHPRGFFPLARRKSPAQRQATATP